MRKPQSILILAFLFTAAVAEGQLLDNAGTVRSTTETTPAGGAGIELNYLAGSLTGYVRVYDRSASAYRTLSLNDNVIVGGGANGWVLLGLLGPLTAAGTAKVQVQGSIYTTGGITAAFAQFTGDLRFGSNGTNTDLHIFTDAPASVNGTSYNQINTITPVTVPASGISRTALYLKNATTTGQGTNQIDLIVDGNIAAKYQDVAEWVPATMTMPPGTVVILNGERRNEVMPSTHAYDTTVAGVVSAHPGLLLGEAGDSKARIATTGRVKVRVDATTHPVKIGDLLVTSDKFGMAMKSEPLDLAGVKIHRPGTLIGKALEPLGTGEGEILVLLSLQ